MSSWLPLLSRYEGRKPLRQKYVLVVLPRVKPIRQLSLRFNFGSHPPEWFETASAAAFGARIAPATAVAPKGKDHTPSAGRQFPANQGSTMESIRATGMISPMIKPLV